jgi:Large ribosomal RNA subunit accumulation protein YceD
VTEDAHPPILSRPLKVDEIKDGASDEIVVTGAELEAIAKMLDLVALDRLTFAYRIDRGGGGRLALTGTLNADAKQTCVVSLEPVEARLEVPVEMEFWPAELLPRPERDRADAGGAGVLDWPEAIRDGKIDLGPVIYETVATALDPYPRRPEARFDWPQGEAQEGEGAGTGPFASLAALKRR